jgi:hypothetical protein
MTAPLKPGRRERKEVSGVGGRLADVAASTYRHGEKVKVARGVSRYGKGGKHF